jgi:ATP-dependent DNA helicase RecQ
MKCDNCDICKRNDDGTMESVDRSIECKQLLRAIKECKSIYGITTVISMLRGITKPQHARLKYCFSYGKGQKHSIKFWKEMSEEMKIKQLLGDEMKENSFGPPYASPYLTEKGNAFLEDTSASFQMKVPVNSKRKYDDEYHPFSLYQKLILVRKQLAGDTAAFKVFSNATLREIAEKAPLNVNELLNISGVGLVKVSKYGDDILACIRNHMNDNVKKIEYEHPFNLLSFECNEEIKRLRPNSLESLLEIPSINDEVARKFYRELCAPFKSKYFC